jgi:hypothetical protein
MINARSCYVGDSGTESKARPIDGIKQNVGLFFTLRHTSCNKRRETPYDGALLRRLMGCGC